MASAGSEEAYFNGSNKSGSVANLASNVGSLATGVGSYISAGASYLGWRKGSDPA